MLLPRKPQPVEHAGPKFSITTSHFFSSSIEHFLAHRVLTSTVIERLLQLSIVKYRLSTFGNVAQLAACASPSSAART